MPYHSHNSEACEVLLKHLVKSGLIKESHAETDFSATENYPIAYFAKEGCFEEDEAIRLIAKRINIPVSVLDEEGIEASLALMDHPSLNIITLQRWQEMRAIPVEVGEGSLLIAMANPLDQHACRVLKFDLGLEVAPTIARESQIFDVLTKRAKASSQVDLQELGAELDRMEAEECEEEAAAREPDLYGNDISAAPIVRLANKILADAIDTGASDIHVNPEKDAVQVRVRVDGMLRTLFALPGSVKNAVISRIKLLAGMDISERRLPQDGRFRIKTPMGARDLRLSTVPTAYGENLVVRILTSDLTRVTFEQLGATATVSQTIQRILNGSARVVLATGPTGSGKTSSLYAGLLYRRDGSANIVTIEDPVEYRIRGVTQIQVNPRIGLSFSDGLRSILRQDPDIIMVGEIRDADTGAIAMQAAQTGHLVLSTIHTNSAAGAVTRLMDLDIPPYLIASSVGAIIAQRLVRKLCTKCSAVGDPALSQHLRPYGIDPTRCRIAVGCPECHGIGYRGRTAVYSVLEVSDSVREAIRDNLGEAEIEARARHGGFESLGEASISLVNSGVTSIEEIERHLGPVERMVEADRPVPLSASVHTVIEMPSTASRRFPAVEAANDPVPNLALIEQ